MWFTLLQICKFYCDLQSVPRVFNTFNIVFNIFVNIVKLGQKRAIFRRFPRQNALFSAAENKKPVSFQHRKPTENTQHRRFCFILRTDNSAGRKSDGYINLNKPLFSDIIYINNRK